MRAQTYEVRKCANDCRISWCVTSIGEISNWKNAPAMAMCDVSGLEGVCASENKRHTGNTMDIVLDVDTLTRGFRRACLEVALKVCDAVLVRVNGVSAQRAELRRDDLEEVLEHVLRFGRLPTAYKRSV